MRMTEIKALALNSDTQNAKVLMHIKKYGGITNYEAMNLYGSQDLRARVRDLRDLGVDISTTSFVEEGRRISRYVFNKS